MLKTFLTQEWNLRHPIICAPMANTGAGGLLARAVFEAGGLGLIGIGASDTPEYILQQSAIARGDSGDAKFGIGLMGWVLEKRPELLEAAIEAKPFLASISFGPLSPFVERLHAAGIKVASQVSDREGALAAEKAGVDLIVAQGTEAGGHTAEVGTLPLLQVVLETVKTPVLAAGGIASARGVAAVLAAGAQGVWAGTCFLVCPEANVSEKARARILAASETDTVLTSLFDRARNIPWPERYGGRALKNSFTREWNGRESEMLANLEAVARFKQAVAEKDFEIINIYAGEGVGLVNSERPVAEVIRELSEGAEKLLRERAAQILG